MRIIDMRPPRIALALTVVAAALHWSSNIWVGARFAVPRTGLLVGAAGFCLMMWPWLLFKRLNLAVCLSDKTAYILTTGPYRLSRNPMYLGMVLIMLGAGLYMGTLPFYVSAAAYFMIINFVFCPCEENKLAISFGAEYADYKNSVRRWI